MKRILVANGPKLDRLGTREPEIYGRKTLKNLEEILLENLLKWEGLFGKSIELVFFQSNNMELMLDCLKTCEYDALMINPAAWTHEESLLSAFLAESHTPFYEVHISNILAREPFRSNSRTGQKASGVVLGAGFDSYVAALYLACQKLT